MRSLFFAAVVFFAAPAFGQITTTHDMLQLQPYTVGQVALSLPPQTDNVQSLTTWTASSKSLDFHEHSHGICFTGPPGTYSISLETITVTQTIDFDNRTSKLNLARTTDVYPITIGNPSPPQPPPPTNPPPPDTTKKITRVTYVYEKDHNLIPRPVSLALQKLNSAGITATEFEEDTKDSSGQVPTQFAIPLAAATQAGLPALVVQSGLNVVRVVKAPKTEAQVTEAAKP